MGALGVSPHSGMWDRAMDDFQHGRHFGGINVAFADGHVKWLSGQTIYAQSKILVPGYVHNRARTHSSLQRSSAWNPWVDNSNK